MSDCKQFEESLADDEDLTRQQRESLERHLVDCGSCREKMSEFRSIWDALRSDSAGPDAHPARELLSRFAVQRCDPEELDYDGRRLSSDELENVESHLVRCDACREDANLAIGDYREVDAYMEAQGLPEMLPDSSGGGLVARLGRLLRGLASPGALAYASGAAAAVLLVWVSPLFRPVAERYYALASVSQAELDGAVVITRADAGELNDGLAAFSQGQYENAIEPLTTHVRRNAEGPSVAYARFVLGLSYLRAAKSDVLGRVHQVDVERLDRAIEHLAEAERTTDTVRVREDALWFLAKGYLLRLDTDAALEALERVEGLNGRRGSDARALAAKVQALTHDSP